MFPFGAEVEFIPSKIAGEPTLQFDAVTQPGIFSGCAVNSSCVWSGAYLAAHVRQFATMNYHSGKSREDDETIVIRIARDPQ
jgi:hypothetical protein